jgi:SAM-dependent methyltransferase
VRSAFLDVVMCRAVSHHLTDEQVDALLAQCARVLAPGGVLVFMDAVRSGRLPGRLLWRLDRGSFPRPQPELEAALSARFDIIHAEEFAIWHRYLLWVGTPIVSRP